MQSPSSLYHDVVFPGGIKSTERGEIDNWPDIANLTTGAWSTPTRSSRRTASTRPSTGSGATGRSSGASTDVSIPVLAIGGWNDGYFRSGTLANIEAVPGRTWAVYGPWEHFFPVALVDEPAWSTGSSNDEQAHVMAETPQMAPGVLLAWFDRWVAGMPDVPVPPEADVHVVRGPGRGRRRMARARSLGPDRGCARRAPARR